MQSKKKRAEEYENHERWMVSYADLVTLLFAFFVVMYAANRSDSKRWTKVTQSIQMALRFDGKGGVPQMAVFDGPPSEGGCAVQLGPHPEKVENEGAVQAWKRRLLKRLKRIREPKEPFPSVQVLVENQRITVRLAASSFFRPGSVELSPEAQPVLEAIALEMAEWRRPIRVEGHTDDLPTNSKAYRNNWELSAFRAATLVDIFEREHGLPPTFLVASGKGPSHPLVPNDSADHREQNRRVDLVMEYFPGDPLRVVGLRGEGP